MSSARRARPLGVAACRAGKRNVALLPLGRRQTSPLESLNPGREASGWLDCCCDSVRALDPAKPSQPSARSRNSVVVLLLTYGGVRGPGRRRRSRSRNDERRRAEDSEAKQNTAASSARTSSRFCDSTRSQVANAGPGRSGRHIVLNATPTRQRALLMPTSALLSSDCSDSRRSDQGKDHELLRSSLFTATETATGPLQRQVAALFRHRAEVAPQSAEQRRQRRACSAAASTTSSSRRCEQQRADQKHRRLVDDEAALFEGAEEEVFHGQRHRDPHGGGVEASP